jgi:GTP:adenosylcobinamide-phosphate guanylyltransferase
MNQTVSVIVLAGRRADRSEPLAISHGVSDKCLVPVGGRPLIEHVLETLGSSPHVGRIIVSINDPALLTTLPVARALTREGKVQAIRASGNLADSVISAAGQLEFPILITTADNVLLSHEAIETMRVACAQANADAAAAFARRQDVLAAHPEGQRRFYKFRDDSYSNCNCYWIANQKALQAAEIFRSGGQFAKNPLRIAKSFGLLNLLRFRFGWSRFADSFKAISARFGLTIYPVIFDDGALAIDVDNDRTHRIVSEIIAGRVKAQSRAACELVLAE